MANVMQVPDDLSAALASVDMTADDFVLAMSKALAGTRIWSAIPAADLNLMLTESGLSSDDQRTVRDQWAEQGKSSICASST